VSYWVWLAIIYFHARRFFACGFHIGEEISSATGGILTTLSFGWAVIDWNLYIISLKLCLRNCEAVAHSQWWILDAVHWIKMKSLPRSHDFSWRCLLFYRRKKKRNLKKKKQKKEKLKRKRKTFWKCTDSVQYFD
jgi:hypothetical protein